MFVNDNTLDSLEEAQKSLKTALERLNDEIDPVSLDINSNTQNLVEKDHNGNRMINLNNAPTDFIYTWHDIVEIFEEEFGKAFETATYTGKIKYYPDSWSLDARFKHPKRGHSVSVGYYADGRVEVKLSDQETYKHYSEKEKIRQLARKYCKALDSEDLERRAHQLVIDYREQSGRTRTEADNDLASAIYIASEMEHSKEQEKLTQNKISYAIQDRRMNITKKYSDMLSSIDYLDENMKDDMKNRQHYSG